MSNTLKGSAISVEGDSPDLDSDSRSSSVDLIGLLLKAMDETRCSQESLAAHRGDKDASFVGKVLRREKPLGVPFLLSLPDDVGAVFTKLHAEAHGHIVVSPVRGQQALEMLAAGLFGVLVERALPERASAMAHMHGRLPVARKRTA